jgi:hypothetical protein
LVINPIIYAEVSIGYRTTEALNSALPSSVYQRDHLLWEVGFLAAKCFLADGQPRENPPMPDFYIGANAAIEHLALLPRDAARFQMYLLKLEILSPPMDLL